MVSWSYNGARYLGVRVNHFIIKTGLASCDPYKLKNKFVLKTH